MREAAIFLERKEPGDKHYKLPPGSNISYRRLLLSDSELRAVRQWMDGRGTL
jgi:hypothetical protein